MSKIAIFVSYAHADLKAYPGYQVGRVQRILEEIKYQLGCHDSHSNFSILRDCEGLLRASYNIDKKIAQAIQDCDIGLVLMSRSYCNSEECGAELAKLLDRKKPLFIVETEPVWDADFENRLRRYYPSIERTLRIQFYGGEPENRVLYGWPFPPLLEPSALRDYNNTVEEVVRGIQTRSNEILRERNAAIGLPAETIGRHTVFLARSTADVRNDVQRLAAALGKAEYSTLSFDPNMHLAPGGLASSVIKDAIEKCDVVVQLLGGVPGARFEGRSLVQLQYDIAKESGKPHLVWRSPAFDPNESDPDYGSFLRSIQSHETSYEEFEQYAIKQVANALRAAESDMRREERLGSSAETDDIRPLVAIDVAEPDVEIANVVMKALQQFAGVTALPFDLDRVKLAEAISDNDGIVLVYAETREGQVRVGAHFPIIYKFQRRNRQFDIAIGNSSGPSALPYPRGPNVHVIKVDRERMMADPESLSNFVDVIRANAARRTPEAGV
jgi:hypothetical protein